MIRHLYVRHEGRPATIACGKMVSRPEQYTDEVVKANCKRCAKDAPGLTEDQREEIWQNANDRRGSNAISPWERAKKKAAREQEKLERAKTREQERLLREQRRRERAEKKAARAAACA